MFGSRDFLKRLGDYVSVKTGKLDANASVEGGRYPFFTCAEKTLSIDTYAFDCNAVLLAGNGEFCVKHYDGKFNAYQRTYVIESKDESILSTKYLYAWLKDYANILKANAIGGVIKYIKLGDIINAQINLPSQDRQLEYVKIYEQADKSKFMRSKSQFIEMFGSMDTTPVGEYVLDSFPGEWGIEDTNGTGVKVIRTTNFTNSGKLNLTDVITREIEMKKVNKKRIMKYDTILERSGGTTDNPVGRVVLFEEDGLYLCNNFTQVLRFKDIDPRFAFYSLFYFYQTNKTAIRGMGNKTTGIQNLNMSKYLGIGIPNALVEQQKAFTAIAEQADKSKLIGLLWKHCHCRDVYTK